MTIDERLDALIGRHEALTQSVELLLHESEKHDEQLSVQSEQIAKQSEQIAKQSEQIGTLATIAELFHDDMRRMSNIVLAHDDAIDDFRSRIQALEARKR